MSFFFGIMVAAPFSFLFLRVFRGRFLWIDNRNFAGALYGFWVWILIMVVLYLDARHGFLGFAETQEGFSFATLLASAPAIAGFISGGILGAVLTGKLSLSKK